MAEPTPPGPHARISIHEAGAGVPSPDAVRQRARELALIDGRAASDYTDADIQQARDELLGRRDPEGSSEISTDPALPFEPGSGDLLGSEPRRAPTIGPDDENTAAEELIAEGMEEALHDEMIEASKKNIRDA